jgi:hypothetical protein
MWVGFQNSVESDPQKSADPDPQNSAVPDTQSCSRVQLIYSSVPDCIRRIQICYYMLESVPSF